MAVSAVLCAGYAVAAVKGFAGACYKGKEGVAKGIVYRKDKEGERRREKLIASPVRVELRRLWRDIVIISLSLISVFISLSFV